MGVKIYDISWAIGGNDVPEIILNDEFSDSVLPVRQSEIMPILTPRSNEDFKIRFWDIVQPS